MEDLKYPIGQFDESTASLPIEELADLIRKFPEDLMDLLLDNDMQNLANPYRPDGWSGAQVIHHCADSHMNAYIRTKLALTEDKPTIMPYDEQSWAETVDSMMLNIEGSLFILKGLHHRWADLLSSLRDDQIARVFHHPASKIDYTIQHAAAFYVWHSNHHLAHIKLALNKEK